MSLDLLLKPLCWLPESRAFWIRAGTLAAATFADGYLTLQGISKNVSEEHNPVVGFYLETFGNHSGMLAVKTIPAIFAIATSAYAYKFATTKLEQKLRNVPIYLGIISYTTLGGIWGFPKMVETGLFWVNSL